MDWSNLIEHWEVNLVAITLIVAAWIDGKELRVPNLITYPMMLSGLIYQKPYTNLGSLVDEIGGVVSIGAMHDDSSGFVGQVVAGSELLVENGAFLKLSGAENPRPASR